MLRVIICLFSLEDLEKEADMANEQLSVEDPSYTKEPYPPTSQHFVERYGVSFGIGEKWGLLQV
jgi:hypothetical protein